MNGKFHFFVFLILFFSLQGAAQFSKVPVQFKAGDFYLENNILNNSFSYAQIERSLSGEYYFVLLQFVSLPDASTKKNMEAAGITLGNFYPDNAFLARIEKNTDFKNLNRFKISAIASVPSHYKIDPALFAFIDKKNRSEQFLIELEYFHGISREEVIKKIISIGAQVSTTHFDAAGKIFIQYNRLLIDSIANLPFISSLQLQSIKDKPLNYQSKNAHGLNALQSVFGKNLKGNNVVIGIGDNADISVHTDFTGRLINRSPWIPDNHGTHVAGTAGGAGIINVKNMGMAPKATLINQYFSDIITNAPVYAKDYNMVVSNNSYYSSQAGCPGDGEYDAMSSYVDAQVNTNKQLLHMIAAGNDGSLTCSPYPAAFGTIKTGWQCAKNVLTVGAINAQNYGIASFSSRGPVKDGRIKPEIVTNGWGLLSTISNNSYGFDYGTSMASPVVTGAVALLYERYRQLHAGQDPTATLMKAVVCNTAEDLGNKGPDYTFGFGMLQARRAMEIIDSSRYIIGTISNGNNNTHNITLPSNARYLKVMLHWNDPVAAVNAAKSLVNDLDLKVTNPAAQTILPYVLNPAPTAVNSLATNSADHTNNIEQVVITNPAAGNYTFTINGFSVPQGPQEYVVTYDIIYEGITIEHPFGGDKLVPGETETIRWSAFGNETNTFKIEFSDNNGSTWSSIVDSASATSRSYNWVVPTVITSNALIRVSRNGSVYTGRSPYTFSILRQPTSLVISNLCEGAIQLSWAATAGATAYDIYQLTADSMKVIGSSATNNYIITGLNKFASYYFGVAAKSGTVIGRRSVSILATPNSGPCTNSIFNNDLKVDSILNPSTARQGFANALDAIKPVSVLIKNNGGVAVSGPANISFSYNDTTVTENINLNIAAGATTVYAFSTPYRFNSAGFNYSFKSWITLASDPNHVNDTAYKVVKNINNDAITALPVTEDFELMPAINITKKEMAIGGNKRIDFASSSARGRARTFVNSGFAKGGNKALTLDQTPYNDISTVDSITLNYNLQQFTNSQLRFDFDYKNQGQPDSAGNKVWIRGNENSAWIKAYDLFANQGALGAYQKGLININDILSASNPPQTVSNTFQVLVGEEGNTSANSPDLSVDIDDGYTFDNIVLTEAFNDIGLLKINSPATGDCQLSANSPINISLKNYNNTTLNNLTIGYRINGGNAVVENLSVIQPNETLQYTFNQTADLSAFIDYNIQVWVNYNGDTYHTNDSILNYTIHNSPVIDAFPYYEGFENSNGYFYSTGNNNTWNWGTPAKPIINKSANGSKAWVTNLTGNYSDNETSYLISPCVDVNALQMPMLSFSHIFDVELDYDYTWVEYSIDGKTWTKLGSVNSGTNWYNNSTLNNWGISNKKWHVASYPLPKTGTTIKIRIVMSSDGGVSMEGIGIDDIRIYESAPIATSSVNPLSVTKNINGNNWVPFEVIAENNNKYLLAEINSQGQNLGEVTVTYFPNLSGLDRNNNNNYYLDRNYVLSSSSKIQLPVGVRLYFTDSESDSLINATGCATCVKPTIAYELGVSKFSGMKTQENGSQEDDLFGFFNFTTPDSVDILPHEQGYYGSFQLNEWGELWLGKGLTQPSLNTKCITDTIRFAVSSAIGSVFQWQLNTGGGFVNIGNNGMYSGTNTNVLSISNIATSYSGFSYHCLVDGIPRNENKIRFTQVWNGNINSDWFNAGNWNCNNVPDQFTDVVIPVGLSRYPTLNNNADIKSLRTFSQGVINIQNGAILNIVGKD